MKKIAWTFSTLGAMGAVVAPIASTVSCNSNKTLSVSAFKESAKDEETILNEMVVSTYTANILTRYQNNPVPIVKGIVDNFEKADYNYTLDPAKWDTPDKVEAMKNAREEVEKIWNTPQGEVIRLAHITSKMGSIMWGLPETKASDAVVEGITSGINSAGFSPDEKLNVFKVKLISNIRATMEATGASSSLKKFEGFIEWMTNPENNYANLQATLMGGKINNDFMYGVQTALNFNTDAQKFVNAFELNNQASLKVSSLTPEQAAWIKNIQASKELESKSTSSQPALKKLFEDSEVGRLDFANQLIGETFGPSLRTLIISAAIGSVWNIPGDVAVSDLKSAVISATDFLKAFNIESYITKVEKTHLSTLDDFIKFTEDIKSSTNKYEFLKKLLADAGATEDDIKNIQRRFNEGKDASGNSLTPLVPTGATKVDIYA